MASKISIRGLWTGLDNVKSLQLFQLLRYGGIILTNILLAKSSLGLQGIGVFETLMFIATGITFFWISGFLKGMLGSYPALAEADKRDFFFNAFLLFQGLGLLTVGILFLFEERILLAFTNYSELPYYHLLCLYLLLNIPTFLVEYIYLLNNRPKRIVQFGVFAFGAYVLVVALPLFMGYSLEMSFLGLTGLAAIKYLWLLALLFRHSRINFQARLLVPFVLLSIPLILNMLVAGGAEYIDGIIIQHYFDKETFAVFRYGAKELPLALALTGAFSSALIPNIAQDLTLGLQEIRQKSKKLMHLLFLISIGLMLSSPFLFPLVFSPDFKDSALIFNIYLLILSSRVWFPQTILIGQKKTGIILWVSLIELAANVILSLLLLQVWGIYGIAIATVIAYLIDKLLLAAYTYKEFRIKPSQYLDLRLYGGYSLLLIASFFLSLLLF